MVVLLLGASHQALAAPGLAALFPSSRVTPRRDPVPGSRVTLDPRNARQQQEEEEPDYATDSDLDSLGRIGRLEDALRQEVKLLSFESHFCHN